MDNKSTLAALEKANGGKPFAGLNAVARMLGCDKRTASAMLEDVPYVKVGNSNKYLLADVAQALAGKASWRPGSLAETRPTATRLRNPLKYQRK